MKNLVIQPLLLAFKLPILGFCFLSFPNGICFQLWLKAHFFDYESLPTCFCHGLIHNQNRKLLFHLILHNQLFPLMDLLNLILLAQINYEPEIESFSKTY